MQESDRVGCGWDDGGATQWNPPNLPLEDINSFRRTESDFPSWYHMRLFWSAYRDWLAARGFYLHPLQKPEYMPWEVWCPPDVSCSAPLPYAERRSDDSTGQHEPNPYLKCAPAQDSHGRDVTIKLVNTYTHEYRIYQDLLRCDELFGQDVQGVLPPVAILDTPHKFSFVVMPTWGDYNPLRHFETVGQVVRFMFCTLKGLRFLHSRRVAHRDIDEQNIMINRYSLWRPCQSSWAGLVEHRRTSRAAYCLFDFNLSVQFPLDTPLRECRLVTENCTIPNSVYIPWDVSFEPYEYDPFAYDVACLGNILRAKFATIASDIPEFAVLFDKMTTHVIHDRFTASEAFASFDETVKRIPNNLLDKDVALNPSFDFTDAERYWSLVPPELAVAWAEYRTPPLHVWYRILDYLLAYRFCQIALLFVRRKLRI